jgi:hypothetical protein
LGCYFPLWGPQLFVERHFGHSINCQYFANPVVWGYILRRQPLWVLRTLPIRGTMGLWLTPSCCAI